MTDLQIIDNKCPACGGELIDGPTDFDTDATGKWYAWKKFSCANCEKEFEIIFKSDAIKVV